MFDDRLKKLRLLKGMNMMQVSKSLGIPYTTYVGYEKNEREPNSEVLLQIADFFECSVDYLLGREKNDKLTKKDLKNIQYAAYEALENESDDFAQDILDYINYKKSQSKKD